MHEAQQEDFELFGKLFTKVVEKFSKSPNDLACGGHVMPQQTAAQPGRLQRRNGIFLSNVDKCEMLAQLASNTYQP